MSSHSLTLVIECLLTCHQQDIPISSTVGQTSTMGTNLGKVLPSREVHRTESFTSEETSGVYLQPERTGAGSSQHSKIPRCGTIQ